MDKKHMYKQTSDVSNDVNPKENSSELSSNVSLENTLSLLESDTELKSFIYQQINDLTEFLTPETSVLVLARDPMEAYNDETHIISEDESKEKPYLYRIAIILKENDSTIEAEGFGDDIYDAIKFAKEALFSRLAEIRDEVESPQDRINAINQAANNVQVH